MVLWHGEGIWIIRKCANFVFYFTLGYIVWNFVFFLSDMLDSIKQMESRITLKEQRLQCYRVCFLLFPVAKVFTNTSPTQCSQVSAAVGIVSSVVNIRLIFLKSSTFFPELCWVKCEFSPGTPQSLLHALPLLFCCCCVSEEMCHLSEESNKTPLLFGCISLPRMHGDIIPRSSWGEVEFLSDHHHPDVHFWEHSQYC